MNTLLKGFFLQTFSWGPLLQVKLYIYGCNMNLILLGWADWMVKNNKKCDFSIFSVYVCYFMWPTILTFHFDFFSFLPGKVKFRRRPFPLLFRSSTSKENFDLEIEKLFVWFDSPYSLTIKKEKEREKEKVVIFDKIVDFFGLFLYLRKVNYFEWRWKRICFWGFRFYSFKMRSVYSKMETVENKTFFNSLLNSCSLRTFVLLLGLQILHFTVLKWDKFIRRWKQL